MCILGRVRYHTVYPVDLRRFNLYQSIAVLYSSSRQQEKYRCRQRVADVGRELSEHLYRYKDAGKRWYSEFSILVKRKKL